MLIKGKGPKTHFYPLAMWTDGHCQPYCLCVYIYIYMHMYVYIMHMYIYIYIYM